MRTIGLALTCLLLACGGESSPDHAGETAPPPAPKLTLTIEGGKRETDGRYRLNLPLRDPIPLKLRLSNEGDAPVQVSHSTYPFYYFFKLEVVRIGKDGKRTPAKPHWDLYPFKDMKMPHRVFVTLRPGESFIRDLAVLVREGYLIESLRGSGFNSAENLDTEGFGGLREPGDYEVTGVWSPEASTLSGATHRMFEGDEGRDESIPVWTKGPVRSKPLRVTVKQGW